MSAILLYNLYPKNEWKAITKKILSNVPHDAIIVHVTLPFFAWLFKFKIKKYLQQFSKVEQIIFSRNIKKQGETIGFDKLRKLSLLNQYEIITYAHSKGTSKKRKNTQPIQDWTEMMRYFVIERLDLCKKAFSEGFYLYGVDLSNNIPPKEKQYFIQTKFVYSGNFVSINNKILNHKLATTECKKRYYGVELFWGTLCNEEKAYCVHQSNTDHYNFPYPAEKYNSIYL